MVGDSNVAPVIIKRKKVVAGGGHHGGAWKVAYADFVTAMMAFFLLMWLLNATTEKQRKGIADYFSPTVAMARVSGGGDGALGGDSVFSENTLPRMGTGATSERPTQENGAGSTPDSPETAAENEVFEQVEDLLMGRSGESMVADDLREHIVTRVTDEGLVVELYETPSGRFFEKDGAETDLLRRLSTIVSEVADIVINKVAVEGHTAAYPLVLAEDPSWKESNRRAMLFRDLLVLRGLDEKRVKRVTAHADRDLSRDNPMDLRNNRLEVVFLRNF